MLSIFEYRRRNGRVLLEHSGKTGSGVGEKSGASGGQRFTTYIQADYVIGRHPQGRAGIALKCCFYLQTDFLVVGSLFPEEMASDEVGVSDPSAAHFFAVCRGEVAL